MNALKTFEHDSLGKLTVRVIEDVEYFSLNDLSYSLGYTREVNGMEYLRFDRINRILLSLDISTFDHGGTKYVKEDGLYDFILESRTEVSKKFRKWVVSEVLPEIRKTGSYQTDNKPMSIEEMIITQAQSVKEVKEDVANLKVVVDNEVWLTESQKQRIKTAVGNRVFRLREEGQETHFQTVYSNLKQYFGVSKYDKIPRKDFEEAFAFVTNWFPRHKKTV